MTHPDATSRDRIAHAFLTRTAGEVDTAVQGRSMRPTIPDGTLVRVRCGAVETCMPGNIVAFAGDGGWIIHRVVHCGRRGKAAGYLLTRGDNRTLPDGPVARERVAGLVTAMCVDKEWVPPPPAGPPAFVARLSVGFLKVLLETSPALAVALARVGGGLRRIYVAPRRIVARLLRRTPR